MLIAARGLQGFGGAVLSPATLSIVSSSFREGPERNRALGLWGAMGALGGSSGALLGGLLTQLLGWSSIFAINVPLGAIVLALGWRLVPRGGELPSRRHFDLLGAVLITTSLVCVTYAIVHTDTSGWGSLGVDAPLGAGLALLAAFAYVEGRVARAPLIPLSALRVGRLRAANLVVLLLYGGFFPVWFFLTIYLQQVRHLDAIEAGLAFVPMTGSIFLASTLAPRVVGRWGARPVIAAGMATAGLGMLLLSGLAPGGTYAGAVLPGALLSALGMGFSLVPATIVAMQGLPKDLSGLGSGLLNTSRLMGGALGLAILSTIADSRTGAAAHSVGAAQALTDGFGLAFLVGAGFAFAGTVVAATLLGSRRGAPGAPAAADLDAPHEPVAGAGEQEPLAA
jgi:MFS family permease